MNEGGSIQSVRRAIDVLFCFDHDSPILTAAEVGARLGLNRSTAWRYLQSLTDAGLVRELDEAGRYALGPRTVRLAEVYTSQWGNLTTLSSEILIRLRDTTDETAALHVRQGWSRVVVSQVESRQELHRTYRDIGEPVSLLLGAPSLAILGWLDDADRGAYLDRHLAGEPDRREDLVRQLERDRARGYTVSRASRTNNVASVAAPVLTSDGTVIGSVNVSGPSGRFGPDVVLTVAEHVRQAAGEIARLLTEHHSGPRQRSVPSQDRNDRRARTAGAPPTSAGA